MNTTIWTLVAGAILALTAAAGARAADDEDGDVWLKLRAELDHPNGYCLDVPGVGDGAMHWKPLIAHNCKPGRWKDELITFDDQRIRFPGYDRCVIAAGVKEDSLPGATVLTRACDDDEVLQQFRLHDDGRLEQADSGLCVTVGAESRPTWSPDHRWRPLQLKHCDQARKEYSRWELAEPVED